MRKFSIPEPLQTESAATTNSFARGLFDTHCHLDMLEGDLEVYIEEAKNAGVAYIQTISVTLENFLRVAEIAHKYDNVIASVGVHPNYVLERKDIPSFDRLLTLSTNPKVVSLGETGLDYYRLDGDRRAQKEAFVNHINVAQQTGLPVIVHTRDAAEDTLDILENQVKDRTFGAIIHCFTQDRHFAYKAIDMGFWISFSGIVTFKNSQEVQFCAANIPMEYMLVETDAPYLAPQPLRGKPNQPAYAAHTAQFLAGLRGIDLREFAATTTKNAFVAMPKCTSIFHL